MVEKFDPSPIELAEHERAAKEVTRLRRKGIRCHLENHPDGSQGHVDVVLDELKAVRDLRVKATSLAASKKDG